VVPTLYFRYGRTSGPEGPPLQQWRVAADL